MLRAFQKAGYISAHFFLLGFGKRVPRVKHSGGVPETPEGRHGKDGTRLLFTNLMGGGGGSSYETAL